jgi:hypothetical protein
MQPMFRGGRKDGRPNEAHTTAASPERTTAHDTQLWSGWRVALGRATTPTSVRGGRDDARTVRHSSQRTAHLSSETSLAQHNIRAREACVCATTTAAAAARHEQSPCEQSSQGPGADLPISGSNNNNSDRCWRSACCWLTPAGQSRSRPFGLILASRSSPDAANAKVSQQEHRNGLANELMGSLALTGRRPVMDRRPHQADFVFARLSASGPGQDAEQLPSLLASTLVSLAGQQTHTRSQSTEPVGVLGRRVPSPGMSDDERVGFGGPAGRPMWNTHTHAHNCT